MFRADDYVKVSDLAEAYELCQKRSSLVVGGMVWMKMTHITKRTIVDLSGLGLDAIEEKEGEFSIGCMCSLRQLETHEGLNRYFDGIFRECTRNIVGVQMRNCATVGGSLISGEWKAPVDIKFNFGGADEGNGGSEPPPINPDLSGLPEIGGIWNGGIVAGIENASSTGADILLMSLDEWSGFASDVRNIIQEEEADGWHLPTEEEAKILHKTFSGSSLDELNETIEGLRNGDPLLDIEKRYVYDHNGSIYAFGFKTSSKFLQAGSTVKYKIRLVCSAHYDAG